MKNKTSITLLVIMIVSFFSCRNERRGGSVFFDLSFQETIEKGREQNKFLCIVLSESDCIACRVYQERLSEKYSKLKNKVIFNIVNTSLSENEWYKYWIGTPVSPVSLIFTPDGKLQTVIAGASQNSFECIENSINGDYSCAAYTFNTPFFRGLNKELIKALNLVLESKMNYDKGIDVEQDLIKTLSLVQYPYNIYLYAVNFNRENNMENAISYAKIFLDMINKDIVTNYLYSKLQHDVKLLIDPKYDSALEAIVYTDSVIQLKQCKINIPKTFYLKVTNIGKKEFEIGDVWVSCDCITFNEDYDVKIAPGESKNLEFKFVGGKEGEIIRTILLSTNASNPISEIKVIAKISN